MQSAHRSAAAVAATRNVPDRSCDSISPLPISTSSALAAVPGATLYRWATWRTPGSLCLPRHSPPAISASSSEAMPRYFARFETPLIESPRTFPR